AATISAAATPIDAVRNSRIDRPDAVSRLYISQSQSRLDLADGENRLDVTAAEGAKHSAAQPSAIALAVPSLHGGEQSDVLELRYAGWTIAHDGNTGKVLWRRHTPGVYAAKVVHASRGRSYEIVLFGVVITAAPAPSSTVAVYTVKALVTSI